MVGTTRQLAVGLTACLFIAVAFILMLRNAAKFQFIGSKQLGFGDVVSVKPNSTADGYGHDSQAVDTIDPSNAAKLQFIDSKQLGFGDLVSVKPNPTADGYGHDSQAVDTIDPSLREKVHHAAVVVDDPFAAYYPHGVSTEGDSSLPQISGLRVAFLGDSLTRYMYLSLAVYLRHGRWITKKDVPNILVETQFRGWNLFYNYTKNYFRPYEQCDCFRPPVDFTKTIENRYFADPVRDNVIYYIQKFGKIKASGHWSHQDVHSKHNISEVFIEPDWSYDWASLITEHISKLRPKPKYLVFNAGIWPHDLGEAAVRESIERALNATDIVGIYKTTTFPNKADKNQATFEMQHGHDAHVCKLMQNRCVDMSWTKNLSGPAHYWDRIHFRPHAYTAMNMQLLNLLDKLP